MNNPLYFMKKVCTKTARIATVCLLTAVFTLAPIDFFSFSDLVKEVRSNEVDDTEYITSAQTWKRGETHIFDKDVVITNSGFLTIEPGVTIQFEEKDR